MIRVFYAGKLYREIPIVGTTASVAMRVSKQLRDESPEIYQGGYLYLPNPINGWYRADLTPVLIEDIPKELRTLLMLLQ